MYEYEINTLTLRGEKGQKNITPEIASRGDGGGGGISPILVPKCDAIYLCPIAEHR